MASFCGSAFYGAAPIYRSFSIRRNRGSQLAKVRQNPKRKILARNFCFSAAGSASGIYRGLRTN